VRNLSEASKERLLIKNIEFENFGPFYGKFDISFSDDPKKSITIIMGDSNEGKTTLHDLIHWGLYGVVKQPFDLDTISEIGIEDITDEGVMNNKAMKKLSKGESCTTSIKMELYDSKGLKFEIKRELVATLNRESNKKKFDELNNSRVPDGLDFEPIKSGLKFRRKGKLERTSDDTTIQKYISDPCPQILRDHFLFDGELLDDFRQSKSMSLIEKGIERISGLHLLDNLANSSGDFYKSLQSTIGSTQLKAKPFQALVDQGRKDIKGHEKEIEDDTKSLAKKNTRFETIIKILSKHESSRILQEAIKKLEEGLTELKKSNFKNSTEFKEFLFDKMPDLLLKDTFIEFEQICDRLAKENKFPPPFTRVAVDSILNSNPLTCVCGRKFEKNDDKDSPYQILNELKVRTVDETITQGVPVGISIIDGVINRLQHNELSETYNNFKKNRFETEEKIESITIQIRKSEDELKGFDPGKLDDLIDEKRNLKDEVSNDALDLQGKKEDLEGEKLNLRSNERKLEGALEKDERFESEINQIQIAKALSKLVKHRRKILVDELRNRTEQNTSKYFLESAPGKEDFSGVKITPNYYVHGVGLDGDFKKLSKGQAHVLGLSFITGMREITNINTFLVIDSPLHNISGQFRNEVSEVLCKYLPGVQLTFLMTDTEYLYGDKDNEPVKEIFRLSGRVWKEYKITTIKKDGTVTRQIKEVLPDG